MSTLILIANSEWALWVLMGIDRFETVYEQEHPQCKEKIEHLVSDRPGRTFSRVSATRHSLNEGEDIMAVEREKFGRDLFNECNQRHRIHPFDELWIVTGPKFLGVLRSFFHSIPHLPYSILEIPKELSRYESLQTKMGKIYEWVHENAPRKGSSWKFANTFK